MTNTHDMMAAPLVTPASGRLTAMDSAKGVGIILVVFGHAWRGAMGAGVLPDDNVYRVVDTAIYAFHMPLFFFLAGLLFLDALRKSNTAVLVRGRINRLLWPMVLWSWAFFGLKILAGSEANAPVALSDFPVIPLPPYEHLWFLWALFVLQTMCIGAFASPLAQLNNQAIRMGAAVLALFLALISSFIYVPSLIWGPMVEHAPYFLAGIAFGGMTIRPTFVMSALLGALFIVFMVGLGTQKPSVGVSLGLIVIAWQAWLNVDRNSTDTGLVLRGLRYLGIASMVIYLTHTAFSAALRIVLLRFGVDDPMIVVAATTFIGVFAPLALLWGAQRTKLVKVLGF